MACYLDDLFDLDSLTVNSKEQEEKINKKLNSTKAAIPDSLQKLNSSNSTLEYRLKVIEDEVMKVLGRYKSSTFVIHTAKELEDYITSAIDNGVIAIDTETNKSLDPITCKIMGLCLYTPNQMNAYVPVNHIDIRTGEKLKNQVTEEDIKKQLGRLTRDTKIIMHNGKFDYQVIKCTCGIPLWVDFDTCLAVRILNENEQSAGLKFQYHDKIDATQEEYDIEQFFKTVLYEQVDPDIFALYSATDTFMTYKLYEYQNKLMEDKSNEGVKRLFYNVEMQLVVPVAEMELSGVKFDLDYANSLHDKYSQLLADCDKRLADEIASFQTLLDEWRKSPDANKKELKKDKDGKVKKSKAGDLQYTKSKNEQLTEPLNLESPTQLAIIIYDVLGIESPFEDKPRCTDKFALAEIVEKYDTPICKILLERRKIATLMDDFIIKLPKLINPVTGAIHCHFNQLGKEERGVVTGRFSSSDPNLQQIPSKNRDIRPLFIARTIEHEVCENDDCYEVCETDEVLTSNGWKRVQELNVNDVICGDDSSNIIKSIERCGRNYILRV